MNGGYGLGAVTGAVIFREGDGKPLLTVPGAVGSIIEVIFGVVVG